MDHPKDFMTLSQELTWQAMQELLKGEPLIGVVRGVMLSAKEWTQDQATGTEGKVLPAFIEDNRRLQEENQQLKDNLKEKSADVMKFAGDVTRLEAEAKRLQGDLALKDAEIDGLKRAPEVIKTEMNALIQTIAQQRDSAEMRAKAAQNLNGELAREKFELTKERDQLKADYTKLSALHQDVAKQRDSLLQTKAELIAEGKRVVAERDEAQSEMSFYKGEHGTAVIRLKETQTKLDTAQDRIKELEAACAQREQALDAAIKERDRYKAELVGADKRLAAIHAAFHKA